MVCVSGTRWRWAVYLPGIGCSLKELISQLWRHPLSLILTFQMSCTYSNHSSSTHSLSLKLQVLWLMTFFDVTSLLWFIQNIYFCVYSKSSNKKEFKQWSHNTLAKDFILSLDIYTHTHIRWVADGMHMTPACHQWHVIRLLTWVCYMLLLGFIDSFDLHICSIWYPYCFSSGASKPIRIAQDVGWVA